MNLSKPKRSAKKEKKIFRGGPFDTQTGILSNGTTYYFRLKEFYGRYNNWHWEEA